ncbi:hypothetical protein GDO81_012063 [Engystomops pustulosus]|uniref:Amphiphysin n=1 Tax=Engystomops pustulosus TaxID=76066 RepID=A0AAV7BIR9_ENGPU|nr:hypothetical protein GDO81_012063 [Engystomops pustulosus]
MQEASLKLTESLHEVYEPDWYGREDVKTVGEKCDELWGDFHQKLVDGALLTLDTYLGQFPDIKNRIAKRSRKLVDYDSARHHLEALQNAKRRDEGRISKAEEEFQKAQKVFEDFNIDLQEELPSLWSRRIGFYVNTFQNISGLEAKFHKEITGLCHKLYEVMTKLGEQHADKAFTIQGAPSDSGPLRIAKTPSPPEESQIPSPLASPNHTLAPASPAPARPKSPSQLRKGPPVPPLPKLTPSKELQQENIISFFEDNFVPEINVTTPSQNETAEEKKVESLLDLDFDPFKPEAASAGVTQAHSPMSQTLPWDLWTTNSELVQPASSSAFNGMTQPDAPTSLFTTQSEQSAGDWTVESDVAPAEESKTEEVQPDVPAEDTKADEQNDSTEKIMETTESDDLKTAHEGDTEGSKGTIESADIKTADEADTEGSKNEHESAEEKLVETVSSAEEEVKEPELDDAKDADVTQDITCIPSVVIEPASNHEDEGEYQEKSPVEAKDEFDATQDSSVGHIEGATRESNNLPTLESSTSQELPAGLLYKAEVLHDFEAANDDELNLKRGDLVYIVASATSADLEAGWLTGIREVDWQQHKDLETYKGLFPENFTRKLE